MATDFPTRLVKPLRTPARARLPARRRSLTAEHRVRNGPPISPPLFRLHYLAVSMNPTRGREGRHIGAGSPWRLRVVMRCAPRSMGWWQITGPYTCAGGCEGRVSAAAYDVGSSRATNPMPNRSDRERLLLEHLDYIDRVAGSLARRHGLHAADAADFASWVKLRLIENDYAILAKFRGESRATTYLVVVLAMLFRDYRVQRWGRWRPTAAARRHGPMAIRLERLVRHDGLRLEEAGEALRTAGTTDMSDRELASLLAELPARAPMRPLETDADALDSLPSAMRADEFTLRAEEEIERRDAENALASALASLPPEDHVIVRMRYWEEMSVADIARALGQPQKPLYRRLERALASMRARLDAAGVDLPDSHPMLSEEVPW